MNNTSVITLQGAVLLLYHVNFFSKWLVNIGAHQPITNVSSFHHFKMCKTWSEFEPAKLNVTVHTFKEGIDPIPSQIPPNVLINY